MHAKILLMTAVLLSSQVYAQATPSDTPDTPDTSNTSDTQ